MCYEYLTSVYCHLRRAQKMLIDSLLTSVEIIDIDLSKTIVENDSKVP